MIPSTQLITFVQEHALPWITYNPDTGRLELIIDNHLLSTYRSCSAYFMLSAVEGYRRRSGVGEPGQSREWFLDFGTLFHRLMEEYYHIYKSPDFSLEDFAIKRALHHWKEMEMDAHLSHKECQEMGGYPGFAGLLVQYATQFKAENEKLSVIASEVSFGHDKQVPLFVFNGAESGSSDNGLWSPADIYLSGRIDIIGDDGVFILPLDHKTVGSFYKDPMSRFLADDGPTGYIYALGKLLPTLVPSELLLKRTSNRILINIISKKIPKEGSRFKRNVIWKSTEQLEAYRIRQIGTVNNLLSDLETYIRGGSVPRDTSKCSNWYFRDCTFLDVHTQQDAAGERATLQNGFIKLPIWDTEKVVPLYGEES